MREVLAKQRSPVFSAFPVRCGGSLVFLAVIKRVRDAASPALEAL